MTKIFAQVTVSVRNMMTIVKNMMTIVKNMMTIVKNMMTMTLKLALWFHREYLTNLKF